MALSTPNQRLVDESATNFGTGSWETGSIEPSANSLLVIVVCCVVVGAGIPGELDTPTGGSLTYTRRHQKSFNNGISIGATYEMWTAPVETPPASLTLTFQESTGKSIFTWNAQVFDFTGYDTTTPIGTTGSDDALEDAGSFNLDATPAASSIVVASRYTIPADGSGQTATPATGWTEIYDQQPASSGSSLQTQYRGSSTSQSVDWDDTYQTTPTTNCNVGIAAEIQVAGAAGAVRATGKGLTESRLLTRTQLVGRPAMPMGYACHAGLCVPERLTA